MKVDPNMGAQDAKAYAKKKNTEAASVAREGYAAKMVPGTKNLQTDVTDMWTQKKGAIAQAEQTAKVFKTDKVFKQAAWGPDLIKESGFSVLDQGVLNVIYLKKTPGEKAKAKAISGGRGDILSQWNEMPKAKLPAIVQEYGKTPGQRRSEAINGPKHKPTDGVDMAA